jgi:DNA invertase Pin-like site-specific DNA recombinase
MATRCALYLRVSTDQQSVDMQRQELLEFCERRGWQVVAQYSDTMSGGRDSRPELNKLMADAHKRRFDAVVVWKFDRFARSVSHLLRALELFKSIGIEFVSFSEAIDTSTAVGKMTFTVLGAVAELEKSLIRERVIAGQRAARNRGVRFGRPRVTVDAREVARLRAEGKPYATIARLMEVSVGSVFRAAQTVRADQVLEF